MRVDFFLKINSVEKALNFYIKELGLFELAHNYGEGNILLKYLINANFCLSIILEDNCASTNNSFALHVMDCKSEFERIQKIKFSNAAGIVKYNNKSLFEYPFGCSFYLKDPFGTEFSIIQEYYDFIGKDSNVEF